MSPRIAPIEPPYDPATAKALWRWMPPGSAMEPLKLFRTLALHPELSARMRPLGAGLLGHGQVEPRERELLILRTCALAGAAYEWGVHAAAFGSAVGLDAELIDATWSGGPEDFPDDDARLIRLADELHLTAGVSDPVWAEQLPGRSEAQLLELVAICGFYRLISYVINAAGVEHESWARPCPCAGRSSSHRRAGGGLGASAG